MFGLFRKQKTETRSSGSGFTAELMAMRESYISGRQGIAELTATAQTCVSLWEGGLGLADITGTDLLDRRSLALIGRSLALRGEALFLIRENGLIPCSDWELKTRDGIPTAYRVSISEAGGGTTAVALAGEVLHVRIGCDPAAPYYGSSPLRRSHLTANLLHAVEDALSDVYGWAPIGSQALPIADATPDQINDIRVGLQRRRAEVLIFGQSSQRDGSAITQGPSSLTPNLEQSLIDTNWEAARSAISGSFGVLPALLSASTTGPLVREAQRHLAQWQLQPIAALLAEEATDKFGQTIEVDTMRPLQAFDAGGRARTFTGIVQGLIAAKEAGIDPNDALSFVNWEEINNGTS